MIETIRGLVRPVVTFLVVITLLAVTFILVLKYADQDIARLVVEAFLILVATVTGYWFGSRTPK